MEGGITAGTGGGTGVEGGSTAGTGEGTTAGVEGGTTAGTTTGVEGGSTAGTTAGDGITADRTFATGIVAFMRLSHWLLIEAICRLMVSGLSAFSNLMMYCASNSLS